MEDKAALLAALRRADRVLQEVRGSLSIIAQAISEIDERYPIEQKALRQGRAQLIELRRITAPKPMGRPRGGFNDALRDLELNERLFRKGYKASGGGRPEYRGGLTLRSRYDSGLSGRWYWWEANAS